MTWPDLVIGAIVLVFALKGFKRGFVAEIGGFIALAAALWAAIAYPGTLDATMRTWLHVGAGSAHVIGMFAFAALVYVALMMLSAALSHVAKLPIIGIGNGLGGAVVGAAKAALGIWLILYVALFFPLSRDLRDDLHHSTLVVAVTSENGWVDHWIEGTMPWFVKPFAAPFFARHRI